MGFWSFVLGGYAANIANNKLNPPTVIPPPGYEIRRMEAKGTNQYLVKYGKTGGGGGGQFLVKKSTTAHSIGGPTFRVYWK